MSKPQVINIGAGFTVVATAHDLSRRGCDVTVVERGDLEIVGASKIAVRGIVSCMAF